MTQVNTENVEGNTKSSTRKRSWAFTLNNHTSEEVTHLTQEFELYSMKYCMQEERGENGTPHLQGTVAYKNARTFVSMKKVCERAHWEPCINEKKSFAYCMKDATRDGRRWSKGVTLPVESPIQEYREWQLEVIAILAGEPDSRSIHWFWEEWGNTGKTSLAKDICIKNKDAIYVSGKANDIKYAVAEMVNAGNAPRIILIDLVRSMELFVSYEAIEAVKNGIFFSGKYEGKQVIFNYPHVIIFANFAPDEDKLSKDRWHIVKIGA